MLLSLIYGVLEINNTIPLYGTKDIPTYVSLFLGAYLWLLTSSKLSNKFIIDYQGVWYYTIGNGVFKNIPMNYTNESFNPYVSIWELIFVEDI